LFLAAFLACGLLGIEAWPLTGWRLFSHLRTDHQVSWRAVTVDSRGRETPIPFARLPRGYRNFVLVMKTYASLPPRQQADVCAAWTSGVRKLGESVELVRIYRVDWYLSQRHGFGDAPPPKVTLTHTCAEGAASAPA
jgi:hypothetical protein